MNDSNHTMKQPVYADEKKWVVYYWVLEKRSHTKFSPTTSSKTLSNQLTLVHQQQMVAKAQKDALILDEVIEHIAKKRQRFPELIKAIQLAKKYNAYLIIPNLHYLARYEAFSGPLLSSAWPFRCLDQVHVNQSNFLVVVDHARKQRDIHRSLICIGLQNTDMPLGNPNALAEITRINKPKHEQALIFSLVMGPIIHEFQEKKYSQRKMIAILNQQQCYAPEGGTWVLSQFQKLLERISYNDCVFALWEDLKNQQANSTSLHDLAEHYQQLQYLPPRGCRRWDENLLRGLFKRMNTLEELYEFQLFLQETYVILCKQHALGIPDKQLAEELSQQNIAIPKRLLFELPFGQSPSSSSEEWTVEMLQHLWPLAQKYVMFIKELKRKTLDLALVSIEGIKE